MFYKSEFLIEQGRRAFLKTAAVGFATAGIGAVGCSGQALKPVSLKKGFAPVRDTSTVSFTASKDTREAAYNCLKPLENDIAKAIEGKKVVIKPNLGQVAKDKWLVWCGEASMGNGRLDRIKVNSPDYRQHIRKYEIGNYNAQRQWIIEDEQTMKAKS